MINPGLSYRCPLNNTDANRALTGLNTLVFQVLSSNTAKVDQTVPQIAEGKYKSISDIDGQDRQNSNGSMYISASYRGQGVPMAGARTLYVLQAFVLPEAEQICLIAVLPCSYVIHNIINRYKHRLVQMTTQ